MIGLAGKAMLFKEWPAILYFINISLLVLSYGGEEEDIYTPFPPNSKLLRCFSYLSYSNLFT